MQFINRINSVHPNVWPPVPAKWARRTSSCVGFLPPEHQSTLNPKHQRAAAFPLAFPRPTVDRPSFPPPWPSGRWSAPPSRPPGALTTRPPNPLRRALSLSLGLNFGCDQMRGNALPAERRPTPFQRIGQSIRHRHIPIPLPFSCQGIFILKPD